MGQGGKRDAANPHPSMLERVSRWQEGAPTAIHPGTPIRLQPPTLDLFLEEKQQHGSFPSSAEATTLIGRLGQGAGWHCPPLLHPWSSLLSRSALPQASEAHRSLASLH